jgi:hypothetical protein
MPSAAADLQTGTFERLQFTGNNGAQEGIRFNIVKAEYGDGYSDRVLVGDPKGTRFFRLVFNVLPLLQGGTIDPGFGWDLQSKADYLWSFFCRQKAGGDLPFWITSHVTGEDILVGFEDDQLTYTEFAAYLFSADGIGLEQRRIPKATAQEQTPNPQQI